MLKRLSYPLSWVEGLTGEGGAAAAMHGSQADSLPTSADSQNSSVFSKVFNRYTFFYILFVITIILFSMTFFSYLLIPILNESI